MTYENLYLAANSVAATSLWHMQLVGVTGPFTSNEIEVQADEVWLAPWIVRGVNAPADHTTTPFYNDPQYYSSVSLNLGGRTADDVWELARQAGQDFQAANLTYYNVPIYGSQNSNTFAHSLMLTLGFDVANLENQLVQSQAANWPLGISFPGNWDARDLVTFTIDGTAGDDWFYAGAKNDTLVGGEGVDKLYGGDGDDVLFGGKMTLAASGSIEDSVGSQVEDYVADTLSGGIGFDTYVPVFWGIGVSAITTTWLDTAATKVDYIVDEDGNGQIDPHKNADGTVDRITWRTFDAGASMPEDLRNLGWSLMGNVAGLTGPSYFAKQIGDKLLVCFYAGGNIGPALAAGYTVNSLVAMPTLQSARFANGDLQTVNSSLSSPSSGSFLGMRFTTAMNQLQGSSNADVLTSATTDDYANGRAGDDTIDVGAGDDIVDAGGGNDIVQAGAGDDEVYGNTGNDQIFGGDGNDNLTGGDENDSLDGGSGDDRLTGDYGNNSYYVDSEGDQVIEFSTFDIDTVFSSISYTLGSALDNLTLTGMDALNATGNAVANVLTGNSAANTLTGLDGNDTLDGGAGDDTLLGGNGSDTYLVDSAFDVVTDTGAATDIDKVITTLADYTLGSDIENLTLAGGQAGGANGNELANIMTGDDVYNELVGLGGNDTLFGGGGNDDLYGGTGNDYLEGGAGDDRYYITDSGDVAVEAAGMGTDQIQLGTGLSWTLGLNFETLSMDIASTVASNATGNAADNSLQGNLGNNTLSGLAGNDRLDGRGGTDTLKGGIGNDLYIYRGATTTITELLNEGTDTVWSDLSVTALMANVENLTLQNPAAGGNINGTGNTLNNIITGNDGANTLKGLGGKDTLTGGAGSDRFVFSKGSAGITATTLDVISDYAKGALGVGDKIDYTVALARGGSATVASATQASINQTTGVATFAAGQGTTLTDAISDVYTRLNAVNNADGRFAFFKVNAAGNYYAFISDGVAGLSANDTVIQMTGVTAISALNLASGDLTIA